MHCPFMLFIPQKFHIPLSPSKNQFLPGQDQDQGLAKLAQKLIEPGAINVDMDITTKNNCYQKLQIFGPSSSVLWMKRLHIVPLRLFLILIMMPLKRCVDRE